MSEVTVRRALGADGSLLLGLVDGLADYEQLPRPDAAAHERLLADGFGAAPRFHCLLAFVAARPAGYALYFDTYSSFLARPTLFLEDLFVLPDLREHGAGSALFRAVAAEALAGGCGRMEWQVLGWNVLAIDFYDGVNARSLDEWRSYRLDGPALTAAASGRRTA